MELNVVDSFQKYQQQREHLLYTSMHIFHIMLTTASVIIVAYVFILIAFRIKNRNRKFFGSKEFGKLGSAFFLMNCNTYDFNVMIFYFVMAAVSWCFPYVIELMEAFAPKNRD